MNLAEYIAQPAAAGDKGQGLQPFLDTAVFFKRPREEGDGPVSIGDAVNWPLEAKRIDDLVTLVFYTSRDHRRLRDDSEANVAALPLRECLQLSFDFPGADAVALVNPDMSWKAFRKENLEGIIGGAPGGGYR